jgi:hypothetical protein
MLALKKSYGFENLVCEGPEFKGMVPEGSKVRLFFNHADDGLMAKGEVIAGFQISGRNHVFYSGDARIDGNTIIISSNFVDEPIFVRFAFSDLDSVNLFNKAGLPAIPFRTDSIPIFIRPVNIGYINNKVTGSMKLSMACPDTLCQIRYTLDGSDPLFTSPLYLEPIVLKSSCSITSRAFKGGLASSLVQRSAFSQHAAINKTITVVHPCSERYRGGDHALSDGIRGSDVYYDGNWQGYLKSDFDAGIDLGDTIPIRNICAGFLQNSGSWIFLPVKVRISISTDGIHFTQLSETVTTESQQRTDPFVKEYCWEAKGGSQKSDEKQDSSPAGAGNLDLVARHIRIFAENIGVCPKWHPGRGDKAWVFVDEVMVNR